ncbi:hypothetical protein BCS42_16995 [Crenothrix sp. D3]|nr:hypothetical protein BCS42_16995 [Crenothrix sp. D3]
MNSLIYSEMTAEGRAAIAFEAQTLEDNETAQLIEASFKSKDSVWCLYADRLTNLNIVMLSLTGVYWKLAATHDFRSAWATQEVIKAVCEHTGIDALIIFECNDIELLPAPIQYDADSLYELKQAFIAKL